MGQHYRKVYVKVNSDFDSTGYMMPRGSHKFSERKKSAYSKALFFGGQGWT